MQKTIYSVAALTPALLVAGGLNQAASAYNNPTQNVGVEQLYSELQASVCRNDWRQAIRTTNRLIGSPGISPSYRDELTRFRAQLQDWRAASSRFSGTPNCGRELTYSQSSQSNASGYAQATGYAQASTAQTNLSTGQDVGVQELYVDLRGAVCRNDWDGAVQVTNALIGSAVSPSYRQQLVGFRSQLQDWRAVGATLTNMPDCTGRIAQAQADPERLEAVNWAAPL